MRFYFTTAIITLVILVGFLTYRQDVLGTKELPYDDEQIGLDDQITIHFSHVVAENTPKGLAATHFAQLVEEKSNGQIIVQIYPNGILYHDENELQALKDGAIQMIAPTISKMTYELPALQVFDLPFVIDNYNEIYKALHGKLSNRLLAELSTTEIKGMTFWSNGFKQIASKYTPVVEVQDFENIKIRAMASPILTEQFNLLGATPIVTTFNELYNELQDNELVAQENTISNLYSKGFYNLQSNITLSNHGILAYAVMMNHNFWKALDEDAQDIIAEALNEMQVWQHDEAIALNEANFEQLQLKKSVELYTLTENQRQSWINALSPIYTIFEQRTDKDYLKQLHYDLNN